MRTRKVLLQPNMRPTHRCHGPNSLQHEQPSMHVPYYKHDKQHACMCVCVSISQSSCGTALMRRTMCCVSHVSLAPQPSPVRRQARRGLQVMCVHYEATEGYGGLRVSQDHSTACVRCHR